MCFTWSNSVDISWVFHTCLSLHVPANAVCTFVAGASGGSDLRFWIISIRCAQWTSRACVNANWSRAARLPVQKMLQKDVTITEPQHFLHSRCGSGCSFNEGGSRDTGNSGPACL